MASLSYEYLNILAIKSTGIFIVIKRNHVITNENKFTFSFN